MPPRCPRVGERTWAHRRTGTLTHATPPPTMVGMESDPDLDQISPEPDLVRSPGGWIPPPRSKPGWDWLPPDGGTPDMLGMPRWLRVWYRTPFLDRRAHVYMWQHGYYWVGP